MSYYRRRTKARCVSSIYSMQEKMPKIFAKKVKKVLAFGKIIMYTQ